MKYILLISMLCFAFTPQGVAAAGDSCCHSGADMQVEKTMMESMDDCPFACCHKDMAAADGINKSTGNTSSTHSCHCVMINITPFIFAEFRSFIPMEYATEINTEVQELSTRYSFSIWTPPNILA